MFDISLDMSDFNGSKLSITKCIKIIFVWAAVDCLITRRINTLRDCSVLEFLLNHIKFLNLQTFFLYSGV